MGFTNLNTIVAKLETKNDSSSENFYALIIIFKKQTKYKFLLNLNIDFYHRILSGEKNSDVF